MQTGDRADHRRGWIEPARHQVARRIPHWHAARRDAARRRAEHEGREDGGGREHEVSGRAHPGLAAAERRTYVDPRRMMPIAATKNGTVSVDMIDANAVG